MKYSGEFQEWYLSHDVRRDDLDIVYSNERGYYYFYTQTRLLYQLWVWKTYKEEFL